MVQRIRDNRVLIGEQGFKHTTVRIKTGCIENRILGLEIIRDGCLQFLVDILRATDKAHTRHTKATAVHHLL